MMLRLGYDIRFEIPSPVAMVVLLNVHPSRVADLRAPDELRVEPATQVESFIDSFGNRRMRFVAQQGTLRLSNSTLLEDPGFADQVKYGARDFPVQELPTHLLGYLLNSRYCEADRFATIASELFGGIAPGWGRVRPFATGYTKKGASDTNTPAPQKLHWMYLVSVLEFVEIFSISRSLCAGRCIFPPALSRVI